MKITPITDKKQIAEILGKGRKLHSDIRATIEEFIRSDADMVEVDNSNYKNPYSCTLAIQKRIKEDRIGGIACISKNKKTYLYKITLEEDIKKSKPKKYRPNAVIY